MTVIAKGGEIAQALQYAKYEDGTVVATKATGKITLTGNPSVGNTVTIGAITYTFQNTLSTANDVKIGTTALATAQNLDYAIRDVSANEGTLYGTGTTPNAAVTSEVATAAAVVFLTAATAGKAGNSTALTKVGANITLSAATLLGGLDGGTYVRSNFNWKRARALAIDYGAQQIQDVFPDEIGGVFTPTGAYKSGVAVAGGYDVLPRLGDSFGEVLFAAFGKDTISGSGPYTHTIQFRSDILNEIPWVAVRSMIPGRDGVPYEGLYGFDNKVANLRLQLGAGRPISGRIDYVGRVPELDHHPEVWPGASYEDFTSNPVGCRGYFKIPTQFTAAIPTTGVVIDFTNETTNMKEEQHYGSHFMSDVVVKARRMTIRFVYKWDTAKMYQLGFGNAAGATTWSPTPFTTTWDAGSNYAFEAKMEAPYNIPSTSTPYSLTVRAYSVFWQPNGAPQLQGNNIVAQEWMGTVLDYNGNYADLLLVNGQSSAYQLPTEP